LQERLLRRWKWVSQQGEVALVFPTSCLSSFSIEKRRKSEPSIQLYFQRKGTLLLMPNPMGMFEAPYYIPKAFEKISLKG
jgi:hypothetical protein